MQVGNDSSEVQRKFISFVARMLEDHPKLCYADISHSSSYPREIQPYVAFLEVLTEHRETARKLLERGLIWPKLVEVYSENPEPVAVSIFQSKLGRIGEADALEFGRLHGHRRLTFRDTFGKGVFDYVAKAMKYGGPQNLVSKDWKQTLDRIHGINDFGDLARFVYVERLCLLGFTNAPDNYLVTGGGPKRGIETTFGESSGLKEKGNGLLQPLLQVTHNERAIFALETFLCCMQQERIRSSFLAYFEGKLSLDQVIDRYVTAFGKRDLSEIRPR